MDLEPCPACGQLGFDEPSRLIDLDGTLAVACRGYCRGCGTERAFQLALAEARVPPGAWGNADASTLIDAGQWRALADRYVTEDLGRAIAALEEVLKFVQPGSDEPPRSAFFTAEGRRAYLANPAQFRRSVLATTLEAYRDLASRR